MGMIVDCFLVNLKVADLVDKKNITPIEDRKKVIRVALQNVNNINYQYSIEIPDDMAMALDHTGRVEYWTAKSVAVRCYKIDWDETEKLRQSDFKFGD